MRRKPGGLVPLEVTICLTATDLQRDGTHEFHGYEIAKRLGDVSDRRLLTAYGTLYRALGRLERTATAAQPLGGPSDSRPRKSPGPPSVYADGSGGSRGAGRAQGIGADPEACATPMCSCMNSLLLRFAVSLVRGWTRAYTWRMPPGLRPVPRCAEVESDLWELQQDPDRDRGLSPDPHRSSAGSSWAFWTYRRHAGGSRLSSRSRGATSCFTIRFFGTFGGTLPR